MLPDPNCDKSCGKDASILGAIKVVSCRKLTARRFSIEILSKNRKFFKSYSFLPTRALPKDTPMARVKGNQCHFVAFWVAFLFPY